MKMNRQNFRILKAFALQALCATSHLKGIGVNEIDNEQAETPNSLVRQIFLSNIQLIGSSSFTEHPADWEYINWSFVGCW